MDKEQGASPPVANEVIVQRLVNEDARQLLDALKAGADPIRLKHLDPDLRKTLRSAAFALWQGCNERELHEHQERYREEIREAAEHSQRRE